MALPVGELNESIVVGVVIVVAGREGEEKGAIFLKLLYNFL